VSVINFPVKPKQDAWVMTVDVYRRPDGSVFSRLSDMPISEIERDAEATVADRLRRLAGQMKAAAEEMHRSAASFEEAP
jgi:hypothetical protein